MRSRKRSSTTSKISPITLFFCGCALIAALSLWTPYPAELVRALQGEPSVSSTQANPGDQPSPSKDSQFVPPEAKPARSSGDKNHSVVETESKEVIDPVAPFLTDPRLVEPWTLERAISMPTVTYPPFPPVLPHRLAEGAFTDIKELTRGLNLKTQVNFKEGDRASNVREIRSNYRATLMLDIVMPTPLTKAEELQSVNPFLRDMLPGLTDLFGNAKVSPFYAYVYSRKQNEVRKNLSSLSKILDRHNFYDTETILELEHPRSGRKVLWLQSEMDVVSDGSDGDRLASMPAKILNSSFYQPSTSYRWRKKTAKPNPLLPVWEKRLVTYQSDLRQGSGNAASLRSKIKHAKLVIEELKRNSFLIAAYDPFIVLPLGVVNQQSPYSPRFGDFAVVIVGDKLYPAIVGDAGPRYKTGEASLRLAKTINTHATSYARPVSDLRVSYLIFPGSALVEKGPPNYEVWESTCMDLLNDIGGLAPGYSLHHWQDLLGQPEQPERDSQDTNKQDALNKGNSHEGSSSQDSDTKEEPGEPTSTRESRPTAPTVSPRSSGTQPRSFQGP